MGTARVKEDDLLKAINEIESVVGKSMDADEGRDAEHMPKRTRDANGAFSDQGDEEELDAEKSLDDLDDFVSKADAETEDDDDDGEEEDDDEDYGDTSDDDDDDDEDDMGKSTISDMMKSSAGDAMDVAPFLETLVDQVSESHQSLRKSVRGIQNEQAEFNNKLAKAVLAQARMLGEMRERLGAVMGSPAAPRRSYLSKSDVDARFDDEAPTAFSREAALDGLVRMAESGKINPRAVAVYEMSGTMDANIQKALADHLSKSV